MQDDPEKGVYRGRREAFTDPEIFELEMKYIFEGNWIYLAHESQLQNNNDYLTTYMGRQPIVISRDKTGELHALINACSHRGAMLCRRKKDNRSTFTCPFHGWTFNNTGRLLKVKDPRGADYPETVQQGGLARPDQGPALRVLPRVPLRQPQPGRRRPSTEHLGGAAKIIDMVVDQSPDGLEVLKGSSTYTYDGNWKVQAENGADGYHVSATHWNYAATTARRGTGESANETKAMDAGQWGKLRGGYYAWDKGHVLLWNEWGNPEDRPLWGRRDEFVQQFGQARADWMLKYSRNLCLYPNVYIMDQFGSQIRHFRPIAVDQTEVTIYCIAPKGESAENRAARIRQYEDFFNASGMATPDDLEEFRSCQKTYLASAAPWNDMSRGAEPLDRGRRRRSEDAGPRPDLDRNQDRGRGSLHHSAQLLAARNAERRSPRKQRSRMRPPSSPTAS